MTELMEQAQTSVLESAHPTIQDTLEHATRWLRSQQDPETGGWGQQLGHDANSLNTAEAIIALLDCGVAAGDISITRGREFLLAHQSDSPPHVGAWTRDVKNHGKVLELPDVLRTSLAIQACLRAGVGGDDPRMRASVEWLLKVRNASGWGYDTGGGPQLLPTASVLLALVAFNHASGGDEQSEFFVDEVQPTKAWIYSQRNPDGSFGLPGSLRAAHTLYALLVMQALRKCQYEVPSSFEARALKWLRLHQDSALDLVEEEIVLDPAQPHHNYQYLLMTDTLVVKACFDAEDAVERGSALAKRALYQQRQRWVEGGGFLGNRTFTWSTAKCLSALQVVVDSGERRFPEIAPEPEPSAPPAPPAGRRAAVLALLTACALLWGSGVALAFYDKFTAEVATFGGLLMLACLLALGFLSERTFRDVVTLANTPGTPPV